MTRLGDLDFADRSGEHDSAAAFLLVNPPGRPVRQEYDGTVVEASPGTAHVVGRFKGASDGSEARDLGYEVVQRGLDMLSILGRDDLLTHEASEEYLVSWRDERGQVVRTHGTFTFSATVNSPTLVVRDAEGNVVPPDNPDPEHHLAFRYFRMSQASDELYDAFRNMYLAFELLLSSRHPKEPGEWEQNWLRRALTSVESELSLSRLFRDEPEDIPVEILDKIYRRARLPLFHAKEGRDVVTPDSSDADRERVHNAYQLLTKIVLEMAHRWYDSRRMGGGVFFAWVYKSIRSMLDGARALVLDDTEPFDSAQQDLSDPRYESAFELDFRVGDDPEDDRAPLALADTPTSRLEGLSRLTKVEVVRDEAPLLAHMLESPLTLAGTDYFEFSGAFGIENVRQPRVRFSR